MALLSTPHLFTYTHEFPYTMFAGFLLGGDHSEAGGKANVARRHPSPEQNFKLFRRERLTMLVREVVLQF